MAPSISAVSGTVATGNSLTITCSGAGTKVRSKPYLFADFQAGTLAPHASLSHSTAFTNTQNRIITTDSTNKRWGVGYVVADNWAAVTTSSKPAVLQANITTNGPGTKFYSAAWRKWINHDTSGNWKWWRLWPSGGAGNYPNAYIGDGLIQTSDGGGWILENQLNVTNESSRFFTYPWNNNNTWQLDEIRIKFNSTPGVADGSLEVKVNNSSLCNDATFRFDYSGLTAPLTKLDFQDVKSSASPGATMRAFCDTWYVDDSWNRVYIGDNATFASCTHLELQPFTSWSNTSITISCRLGSFASVATGRYMFLVDNDNVVSASYDLQGAAGAPAPTIISLSPSSGPAVGGTTVTATCTSLVATPSVTVGGANATSETYSSATSMTFVTPSGTAGARDVVVTNPDTQTGTLLGGFTYVAAPTLSAVSPSTGGTGGGTTITLTGTGIDEDLQGVTLGGTACTSVTWVSATSVTCVIPAMPAATYSIVLTNEDGQTATLASSFVVSAPPVSPTVTECVPDHGPQAGGTLVTITGADFTISDTTVLFDGVEATSVVVSNSTTLTCVAPAHAAGAVNVVVTNSYDLTGTLQNGFTYDAGAATVAAGRRRTLAVGRTFR